jgi:hypothetical protein
MGKPQMPTRAEFIEGVKNYRFSTDEIVNIVISSPTMYGALPNSMRGDLNLSMITICNGATGANMLQFAPDIIRDNDLVGRIVAETAPHAVQHLTERLRANPDIMTIAITNDGTSIQHGADSIKDNDELAGLAISSAPESFRYLSERLRNNYEVARNACKQDIQLIEHVGSALIKNHAFLDEFGQNDINRFYI